MYFEYCNKFLTDGLPLGTDEVEWKLQEYFGERYQGIVEDSRDGVKVYIEGAENTTDLITIKEIFGVSDGWKTSDAGNLNTWIKNWKESFQRLDIGIFTILPYWLDDSSIDSEYKIILDPSSAFGTGDHETTQLCIQFISDYESMFDGANVIDLGAGSAILSIASAKVQAERPVIALENDAGCISNAHKNISLNSFSLNDVEYNIIDDLSGYFNTADIVVCNILWERIKDQLPEIANAFKTGHDGHLIFSGYLANEIDEVRAALNNLGFDVSDERTQGDWGGLLAKIHSSS
jgi:ribosomal protein L11 methyltransferase